MKSKYLYMAACIFVSVLAGCDGKNAQDAGMKDDEKIVVLPVNELADFKFHTLVANIPSPLETYDMLYQSGAAYKKDLSNTLENRNKYYVESSKAENFGVYMADFGYALLNNDNQKALKYYAVGHELAKDLGFSTILDEVVNERLIENVGNSDSAKVIIDETYQALDKYLQSNDQLKTSGYIITGGWIQSQYIVLNMLGESASDTIEEHLRNEVFIQKLHIVNLISFLQEYREEQEIAVIIGQLEVVQTAYDKLQEAADVQGDELEGVRAAVAAMRSKITG